MPKLLTGFLFLCGLLPGLLSPILHAQDAPPDDGLIPATFNKIQDKLGFAWDLDSRGAVRYGTNYAFSSSERLFVNDLEFQTVNASQRQMNRTGTEYHLSGGRMGDFEVTRRIRVDVETSTIRYLEIFENATPSPKQLTVRTLTILGTQAQQLVTNQARVAAGALVARETGLLALLPGETNRPSVLMYAASSRSRLRPVIQNSNNQQIYTHYSLTVPARQTVVLIRGLAQRNLSVDADLLKPRSLNQAMDPFYRVSWTADLPAELQESIVNRSTGGDELDLPPLLAKLEELAGIHDVNISETDDLLYVNEETLLPGKLIGTTLSVETRLGKTAVPLADVAALSGGADQGRAMTVYCRSGEILVGDVTAPDLKFEVEDGASLELVPARVNLLFSRRDKERDSKLLPDAVSLLTTRQGDQLLLKETATIFRAATPWGQLETPLSRVKRLARRSEPQPLHSVQLEDGSELSAIPLGGALDVESLRFGKIDLPLGNVVTLVRLKQSPTTGGAPQPQPESEPAPEPPPANAATEPPKTLPEMEASVAQEKLAQARELIKGNDYPAARKLAEEVRNHRVVYGAFDDRPELLLDELARLQPGERKPPAGAPASSDESTESFAGGEGELTNPLCRLAGDNQVVGQLAGPELEVLTAAGLTKIPVERIYILEPDEDADDQRFRLVLADEKALSVRIPAGFIPLKVGPHDWRIPLHHLVSFRQPVAVPR